MSVVNSANLIDLHRSEPGNSVLQKVQLMCQSPAVKRQPVATSQATRVDTVVSPETSAFECRPRHGSPPHRSYT